MINKNKIQNSFLVFILAAFVFTGCGDKEQKEQTIQSKTTSTPQIEVIENKNAKEIKVQEQVSSGTENKSYYLNYNVKSEYDENSQPANKDASVRVKPRTVIDANLHVRSPYEKIKVSLMVKKLSKQFIVKCSSCHNDYANGIIGPSLLDKTANQIVQNIQDFKNGKKVNPLMTDLIKMMSDQEIESLANEIYKFNKEIQKLGKEL